MDTLGTSSRRPPWSDATWRRHALDGARRALDAAGRPLFGQPVDVYAWGRSWVCRAATREGELWIKHGYDLPPGEEQVLARLAERTPHRVPGVAATWPGGVAMEPLPGRPLRESDPRDAWVQVSRALGELLAGELDHVPEWLALGVRDRRPGAWAPAVDALLGGSAVAGLEPALRRRMDELRDELVQRYTSAFRAQATLVPQDAGSCNVHLTDDGPLFFDWADVVVGHPTFACDRLLDQCPAPLQDEVIGAFCEATGLEQVEFRAMRRSNVLHEVLRYHDELAHLAQDDSLHAHLTRAVRAQLRVLGEHASRGRS